IRAVQIMAEKTGIYGMLGGQSVDVENDGKAITKEMLDYIYEHKTSALIEASMMTGAVLAGADAEETAAVEKAASYIGLAFQIREASLDVASTSRELGKPDQREEKYSKVTYVTPFGPEEAYRPVAGQWEKAVTLLEGLSR